jgi:hypothetical protein
VRGEHGAQPGGDDLTVDGTHLPEAGGRRQGALEDGSQRRLVDLEDHVGAGHEPAHVADMAAEALGERFDDLAGGSLVGDRTLAPMHFDRGRERPCSRRPGP